MIKCTSYYDICSQLKQCLISFIPGIDAQSWQGEAEELWKIQERAGKSTLSFALGPFWCFHFDRHQFSHNYCVKFGLGLIIYVLLVISDF